MLPEGAKFKICCVSEKYFGYPKNPNYYLPKSNETPDDSQSRAHTIKTKPPLIDVEEKRLSEREREDYISNQQIQLLSSR